VYEPTALAKRPDSISAFHLVAEQLAPLVITWRTLMDEHTPTPDGYCAARSCGRPGYGTADYLRWPCGARGVAELARSIHDRGAVR
jgi:hypothetical protein